VAKIFLDTNILVYTLDTNNGYKQKMAQNIFIQISENEKPVVSTQVLQEFYYAAAIKIKADTILVKNILHNFTNNIETVQVNRDIIEQGIDISILSHISFWDGLIIAAAEYAGCSVILSEDLKNGQIIRGVEIKNPFK
jgi:predicted nucleic acid-binding protein